jgi:hypothetical protein
MLPAAKPPNLAVPIQGWDGSSVQRFQATGLKTRSVFTAVDGVWGWPKARIPSPVPGMPGNVLELKSPAPLFVSRKKSA